MSVLRLLSMANNEENIVLKDQPTRNSSALRHRSDHHVSVSFLGQKKPFSSAYSTLSGRGGMVGWPPFRYEVQVWES